MFIVIMYLSVAHRYAAYVTQQIYVHNFHASCSPMSGIQQCEIMHLYHYFVHVLFCFCFVNKFITFFSFSPYGISILIP